MKSHAAVAAALIIILTIIVLSGFVMLRLLFGAWRRFDSAQRPAGPSRRRFMPDIWQAGGDRLLSRLEQQRRGSSQPDDADADAGEQDADDDDSADEDPPPPSA